MRYYASRQPTTTRPLRAGLLVCLAMAACKGEKKPTPPAESPAIEIALAGAAVMIGAGDIAMCGKTGDEQTAAIIDSVLKADSAANVKDVAITIGDNVYSVGSAREFVSCFTPSWGDSHKRIMKSVRPSPGNHDYDSRGAEPYFQYFGSRAGPGRRGYYSYDIGDWHVVSLNSELPANSGRLVAAKAQDDWLQKDLAQNRKQCTVAYFHRPLFSSGDHGNSPSMRKLWDIMYANGVDLVLNGHDHHYERFLPQTPAGVADSARGIAQIIVGTGGGTLRGVSSPRISNSASAVHGYYGVLKLSLGAGEYRHAFLDTRGRIWDEGGGKCH
ncbi:MAG: metallophosphoesterase [Gemmatimonadales bacterium]